jgi:hypothetical protein
MNLEDRIDEALAALASGFGVGVDPLLADGYARAHSIEREILRLVRRCDSLLDEGSSAELWRTLRRRAALRKELTTLRLRLETVRALAGPQRQ